MFCENDAAFDFGAIEDGNRLYFVGHSLVVGSCWFWGVVDYIFQNGFLFIMVYLRCDCGLWFGFVNIEIKKVI